MVTLRVETGNYPKSKLVHESCPDSDERRVPIMIVPVEARPGAVRHELAEGNTLHSRGDENEVLAYQAGQ